VKGKLLSSVRRGKSAAVITVEYCPGVANRCLRQLLYANLAVIRKLLLFIPTGILIKSTPSVVPAWLPPFLGEIPAVVSFMP